MNRASFTHHAQRASCICLLTLSLAGCRSAPRPRNTILITLDTQRADYVSAYGAANARTPNIDELAAKGLLFRNAYSLTPITLPSHASIFFSEPPDVLKNYNNGQVINKKRTRPSFVNLFKKRGFKTAAFVSLGVLESHFGLEEGFDVYEAHFPKERWYLFAEEVNARVFPWLEANKEGPFFLWIHYSDPHDPYCPPSDSLDTQVYLNDHLIHETCLNRYTLNTLTLDLKPGTNVIRFVVQNDDQPNPDQFMARLDKIEIFSLPDEKEIRIDLGRGWYVRRSDNVFFFKNNSLIEIQNSDKSRQVKFIFRGKLLLSVQGTRNQYRKDVEYMDGEIGKLWAKLEAFGLFDTTAVIMAGDHGEGLGEYSNSFGDPHIGHIHFLYDKYMKVPLILYLPDSSRMGKTEDSFATLLDIAPTVSRIMGFETMSNFQGRDLLNLDGKEPRTVFQQTWRPEAVWDKFGILRYPWHMIFTPQTQRYELFHIDRDPDEKNDVSGQTDLPGDVAKMKQDLIAFVREALRNKVDIQIDKKTEEMLRALGYIK